MAGRGPAPKEEGRRRRNPPVHDWKPATAVGWQHGPTPKPPSGLLKESRAAWDVWFDAWFASFWTPADLPALRHVIKLYDQCERGEYGKASELRMLMDTYGVTPKGQQDRRWKPPVDEPVAPARKVAERYSHLRAVDAG